MPTSIRDAFPFLKQETAIHYLDNAATSQKPQRVIDRMMHFYSFETSNVHRGVYKLAEQATAFYEGARKQIAYFVGEVDPREIIFTSGTTDSINLVAQSWGGTFLKAGDEILVTIAEHHSNKVPWQMVAKARGAKVVFAPLNEHHRVDLNATKKLINKRTKIVAFAHVSNVLGVIHPVKELVALAKQVGAITVIDGAQAIPHFDVNVRDLDCDFYAFSSHKMCGPTGVGVLYGRLQHLEAMPPYRGGGEMIRTVTTEESTWNQVPHKFEAGTPHIGGVIGLSEAVAFLQNLDREKIFSDDVELAKKFMKELKKYKEVKIFVDSTEDWIGTISFHHNSIHPHDIATILDSENVCVRAGNHCAQPLMRFLGVPATTRISPFLYNDDQDLEKFVIGFKKVESLLLR
jgi:SufS family cysteine desulfurase